MSEKQETKLYITDEKSLGQRVTWNLKKLLHTFFDIFYVQYKACDVQVRQYSKQRQKIYHTFNMILYSLQLVSLVFPPVTPGWSKFSLFSEIVNTVRGDYILVKLGLGMPCYFFAMGITSTIFVSLLVLFVKSLKKVSYDIQNYKLTLTNGLSFIKNFSFIPFLCIFSAVQKFEMLGNVDEYGTGTEIELPVPYLGLISIFFAVILVLLALVENTFQYQQFLNHKSSSIFSRAHSKIETLKIFLSTTLVYSYFYVKNLENSVHLLISVSIGIVQWYLYTFYQPFYHLFTNFTHSVAYLLLFWASFVQLFAILLPNSTMVFLLILLVSPCLVVIQWNCLKFRKSSIQKKFGENLLEIDNIYQCELLIRSYSEEYLKQRKKEKSAYLAELKDEIFIIFKFMRKRFKWSNLQAVWEFIFSYTLLQDEGLARIKLSGTSSVFDIEGSYLYYKYCRFIDDFSIEYLEEVDFVKFRKLYEQALKQDKKTCFFQFEFWKELSSEKPNVDNLEKLAFKVQDNLKKCRKLLEKVTSIYPNNQLALKLHGTFLLEVFNDTSKGNELLSKAEHEKQQMELRSGLNEKFNYFDDINGILIISGEKETIGSIMSINQPACDILRITQNFAVSTSISNFLPPPFNNKRIHNDSMYKFLENSFTTSVSSHPFLNYFIDSLGYLVEVYMQIKCVALNDSLYFLVGIKKKSSAREVILYESDSILANTRGFAKLIGFSETETSLKGMNLSSIIKDFEKFSGNRENSEIFQYMIPKTVNFLTFKFTDVTIKRFTFQYLLVSDDKEEIAQWSLQQAKSFHELAIKKKTVQEPLDQPIKKGILKLDNIKKGFNVKGLSVKFDLQPQFFYLNETDFKAGRAATGKTKDAACISVKKKTQEKVEETEKPQDIIDPSAIMDLKDLQDDLFKKSSEKSEDMSDNEEDVGKVKRSGASVASSAQSSNASFTSSAEALSLLTGVTTSMKSFKIAFFLTIFIVNIAVIAMIVYLKLISTTYIETIIVKDLSNRRVLMVNITTFARNLELRNHGLEGYNEKDTRALLADDVATFEAIIKKIESKISDWDKVTKKFYKSKKFKTWDMIGGKIVSSDKNLMNLMKSFVQRAMFLKSTELKNFTGSNPDLFYLYRNGLSESFSAVNASISTFTDEQEKLTKNILMIVLLLALAAIILMVICFVAVLIPTLISVENSNRTVWRLFYLLPLDLIQEMRSRCEERLEMTHGVEPEISEENSKFKSIVNRKNIKLKKKCYSILIRISFYYLISMGLFIFFYYFAYKNFGEVLTIKPKLIDMAGQRTSNTNAAYFWLQECKYKNSFQSFKYLSSNYSIMADPEQELLKTISDLLFQEESLVYKDYKSTGQSSSHSDYILKQACWSDSCGLLSKGLHSGVLVYVSDIQAKLQEINSGFSPSLDEIYKKKNELQYGEQVLFDLYDDYMTSTINFYINTVISVTSSYCLIVTLMYLLIYIPIINSVREEITKIWELGRLIPIEHRNKIMTAFKQASGKIKF